MWAILGVLKTGAAFTIMDPAYPAARLIACMEVARPRAWLEIASGAPPHECVSTLVRDLGCCRVQLREADFPATGGVLANVPANNPNVVIKPDDPAVITFTSGSTGSPKAIVGRHGHPVAFHSVAGEDVRV